MLQAAASGAQINPERVGDWLKALLTSNPAQIDAEIDADLEALIGDSWLFDPAPLRKLNSRQKTVGQ